MATKKKGQGIFEPSVNDVLSGKGKGNENHPGNIRYRAITKKRRKEYVQLSKTRKKNAVAMKVLQEII